ncbi:MAG: hypothetical protein KDI09_08415 [Halioglobus sp.]|nr:hypothetical protein [Halioglobus sp.]
MKIVYLVLLGSLMITGCSDGSDNRDVGMPQPPPVDPGPVDPPPSMQSFSTFVRGVFSDPADAQPRAINGVEFVQDADDDDFADLLR